MTWDLFQKTRGMDNKKPMCVCNYNFGKGELKNKELQSYLLERKIGMKCYLKFLMTILNITSHSTYIYSTQTKKYTNLSGKSHEHLHTTSTIISNIWQIFTQSFIRMPLQKTFCQNDLTYWWEGKAPENLLH